MEVKEHLLNRLDNWKFKEAYEISKRCSLTALQHGSIHCLSKVLGDSGWLDGEFGSLVANVVSLLCASLEEE